MESPSLEVFTGICLDVAFGNMCRDNYCGAGLTCGLNDLESLLQTSWFCDSVTLRTMLRLCLLFFLCICICAMQALDLVASRAVSSAGKYHTHTSPPSQALLIKAPVARLASLLTETLLQDFYNNITSFLPALIWMHLSEDVFICFETRLCLLSADSSLSLLPTAREKETVTEAAATPVPGAVQRSLAIAHALGDRSHFWNVEAMERRGSGTSQSPLEWLCITSHADEYSLHAECWVVLPYQTCPGWEKHPAHIPPVLFWSQEPKQFLLIGRGSSSK